MCETLSTGSTKDGLKGGVNLVDLWVNNWDVIVLESAIEAIEINGLKTKVLISTTKRKLRRHEERKNGKQTKDKSEPKTERNAWQNLPKRGASSY